MRELDKLLDEVTGKYREKDFKKALELFPGLEWAAEVSPCLLQIKAALIQLQDDEEGSPLSEAENCLLRAHKLNPRDPSVLLDLARFYEVVMDDSVKAAGFFNLLAVEMAQLSSSIGRDDD